MTADLTDDAPRAPLSRLVASISPSATLAITARAKAMRAAGVDVISFGAGEPDFPTPHHVVEAAAAACEDAVNHKYTPTPGRTDLREAVAAKTERDSGLELTLDQVLVTNGGKQAVFTAFMTVLDPGDEVLLPSPYWVTYPEAIRLAGAVPVAVPSDEASGYKVTVDQLEAAATDRTKAMVFVSPSNPTGAVYTADETAAIGAWAAERGIWVISDEIYEHLTYGEDRFSSMPVVVPEVRDRCLILNGVSKAYSMTGWRVGWMLGPTDAIAAAGRFQSHVTSHVCNIAQAAALAALTGPQDTVAEMRTAFDRRRKTMHAMLRAIPGVDSVESHGAFYEFPSFRRILGTEIRGRTPTTAGELAEVVLEEARVAFVPGDAFGAPGYGRFSYAVGDEELEEGLTRLTAVLGG